MEISARKKAKECEKDEGKVVDEGMKGEVERARRE